VRNVLEDIRLISLLKSWFATRFAGAHIAGCNSCQGTGSTGSVPCTTCNGSGQLLQATCSHCGGSGICRFDPPKQRECADCDGFGVVEWKVFNLRSASRNRRCCPTFNFNPPIT